MPEWVYEAGIGEARAALIEDDRIVDAAIELPNTLRLGTVARAQLVELTAGGMGRLSIAGDDAVLPRIPKGLTKGATLTVEIVREAIPEPGRPKPPRAMATDATPADGPDLLARLHATGLPVRTLRPHEPDALEAAGWSELLEEAMDGAIAFPLGALRLSRLCGEIENMVRQSISEGLHEKLAEMDAELEVVMGAVRAMQGGAR